MGLFLLSGLFVQQSSAAPNQIDGEVFRDYDADGVRDGDEPGVANVTVFVIDAAGNTATTTTDNLGEYAIVSGDGAPAPLSGDVRIEFTLPVDDSLDFMQPGMGGGTTVQFADIDVGATAVVGINNPAQYSQPDPQVALARFEPGQYDDAGNAGVVAIKSHAYSANGTAAAVPFTNYADVEDVGTIYGMAYEATSGVLWGSTYIRRGAGVGPTDSTGTIYKLTGAGSPGVFLDLPALGFDTGANPHPNDSGVDWIRDNATFPVIGKVGLGDIDVSDDGQDLYAVNLFTRELVIMPLTYDATGQPVAPTAVNVTSMTIPVPAQCNGDGISAPHPNDWRPFALKSYDGKLYVGGICSAQTMLENANPTTFAQLATIRPQVQAHVFEFDPDTNTFNTTPILSFPMNYAREQVNDSFPDGNNNGDWLPWNDAWRPPYSAFTGSGINANPQPILVDIEFDGDGFMTLGFRDRYADQAFASNDLGPLDGNTTTNQRFGGDVLLACLNGAGNWQLESASSCTNGLTGETRTAGTSDDAGTSSPEFYHNDQYLPNGGATAQFHDETAWGALALLHGTSEIMVTKYDAFSTFEAGTIVYNENNGNRLRAVQVYPSNDSFGKAGGIGDIELLPDPAPIELGSRVWSDNNGNGIQDPGEGVPDSITVTLWADTDGDGTADTQIGTTTTDPVTGAYSFNNANVTGDIERNTVYEIRIDMTQLSGSVITTPDAPQPANGNTSATDNDPFTDVADSDAVPHGSVPNTAVIVHTTGGPGSNNHGLDFGFIEPVSIGSYVWEDLNNNGLQDGGEPGIENALVELWVDDGSGTFVPAVQADGSTAVPSQTTSSDGQYFFDNLPPGRYQVRVTPPVGFGPTLQTTADDDPAENDSNIAGAPIAGAYPSGIFTLTVGGEPVETGSEAGDNQDDGLNDADGNMTVDFGFVRAVSIGSFVWEDVDADGIQDAGEPGIAGATVSLWFDTGLPATYPGGIPVPPQITGPTGAYFFDGLPAGDYRVRVTPPAGYVPTLVQTAADNNDNETDSNIATPVGGAFESGLFTLSLGGEPVETSSAVGDDQDDLADADGNMTVDFGFIRPLSVGSLVWLDQNGNGLQDSGEPGIDGVQVTLWVDDGTGSFIPAVDISGTPLGAETTSGGGLYFFDNLPPGEYYVEVTNLPAGHAPSPVQNVNSNDDIENDSNIASSAAGVHTSGVFTLSSGSEPDETGGFAGDDQDDGVGETSGNMTIDFGFVQPVSIGSYVWLDENGDGLQDASEPPLAGANVALFVESGGTFVAATYMDGNLVPVQPTGANGLYFFDNLPAGNYRVRVTPPVGYAPTLMQNPADNDDAEDDSNIATDVGGGVYESGTFALTVDGEPVESGSFAGDGQDDALDENNGNMTVDFGFIEPVSIGSFIWEDLNNNGLQEVGEPGIENAQVVLLVDDGIGNFVAAVEIDGFTAVAPINTGPNGQYFFDNLPPGRYQVQVTPPVGYVPSATQNTNDDDDLENDSNIATSAAGVHTSGIFTLVSNNEPTEIGTFAGDNQDDGANETDGNMTVDFGFVQTVSIGSYVWVDENGDGLQDATEPAIAGADVTLLVESGGVFVAATYVDGSPVLPQTTGADGLYFFDDLPAGSYRVQVSPPAGYVPSLVQNSTANDDAVNDSNIATDLGAGVYESATFTLTVGGEPNEAGAFAGDAQDNLAEANGNMTVDFGFIEPLSIGSFVWLDENGDGLQDVGEPGIENALLELLVDDGSGNFVSAIDVNGDAVANQTTGPAGEYNFTNLPPGRYQVQVTPPAGFTPSGTQNAADDDAANDSNIATSAAGVHTSGIITLSVNGEPTETGGFAGDAQDDGADETDGNMTVDFGFVEPVSIGSFVWEDLNNNGLQNVGEPGIANATVELLADDGAGSFGPAVDVNGGTVASQTTAADGQYHFTNLPPGRYQVRVTPPADYVPSGTQNAGNDDDAENDSNIATASAGVYTSGSFTLASNSEPAEVGTFDGDDQDDGANEPDGNMTVDFGFVRPLSIGSFVWWDLNGDGLQDAGEPGIENALVELLVNDGTGTFVDATYIVGTLVPDQPTGADGSYFFAGLPAGEYRVRVTPPAGYLPSLNQNSSNDDDTANDSNIATTAAGTYTSGSFTLSVGGEPTETGGFVGDAQDDGADDGGNMTVDFGFITPVSIGSFVWEDLNNNGLQDVGEPGIENATVALLVDDGTGSFVAAVEIDGSTAVTNQTTGVDGLYFFDNLPPGSYRVQVTPPATYVPSGTQTTANNNDSENDSNIATSAAGVHTSGTFALIISSEPTESGTYAGDAQDDGANETDGNMTVDFGFFQPVAVGNVVWEDDGGGAANFQDGEFDFGASESAIPGITIELYQAGDTPGVDAPFMSMVTNSSGEYLFDMIPAGDYFVHLPAFQFVSGGILASFVSSPGNDAVDVDADDDVNENGVDNLDPRNGGISSNVFTLTPGGEPTGETGQGTYAGILPDSSVNMTIDFGLFELLTLGNVVWFDDNNNGAIDSGETGVPAGVVLYLLDGNGDPVLHPVTGQPISTTTAADGSYDFLFLYPGSYIVQLGPENFQPGGLLEGYIGSTGSSDPDANSSDSDDNGLDGTDPAVDGIVTAPITLEYHDEPANGADTDNNDNTNLTVDFGVTLDPTAVELISFSAVGHGDGTVSVQWVTGSEEKNFGFELLRSATNDFGTAESIYFESSVIGNGPGKSYSHLDTIPNEGVWYYWLVDIDTEGKETIHGPVEVNTSGVNTVFTNIIFLPMVVNNN